MFSETQENLINLFIEKIENKYKIKRESIDSLWKEALNETRERSIIESKLNEDVVVDEQSKIFSNFTQKFIEKKYRAKMISYLFHIHPDDRWAFMEKIINKKKLSDRRPYIESLFGLDEKLEELDEEVYGEESKEESKEEEIRHHADLYDYKKNTKSKSLIYQAFIKKVEEQPSSKRETIYIHFTGMSSIGVSQKERPEETRASVYNNFFLYLDKMKKKPREELIDLLFFKKFNLYTFANK